MGYSKNANSIRHNDPELTELDMEIQKLEAKLKELKEQRQSRAQIYIRERGEAIVLLRVNNARYEAIAEAFGISVSNVRAIEKRELWKRTRLVRNR